jgi:hypothetical protein
MSANKRTGVWRPSLSRIATVNQINSHTVKLPPLPSRRDSDVSEASRPDSAPSQTIHPSQTESRRISLLSRGDSLRSSNASESSSRPFSAADASQKRVQLPNDTQQCDKNDDSRPVSALTGSIRSRTLFTQFPSTPHSLQSTVKLVNQEQRPGTAQSIPTEDFLNPFPVIPGIARRNSATPPTSEFDNQSQLSEHDDVADLDECETEDAHKQSDLCDDNAASIDENINPTETRADQHSTNVLESSDSLSSMSSAAPPDPSANLDSQPSFCVAIFKEALENPQWRQTKFVERSWCAPTEPFKVRY